MIRCPRCGAEAQWGAPHCPRCLAPFCAPPTTVAPPAAWQPAEMAATRPRGSPIGWLMLGGLLIPALAALVWFKLGHGPDSAGASATPEPTMAVGEGARPEGDRSGGLFSVQRQTQKAPVVAIVNGTSDDLRLMLQDERGSEQTQWIPAGATKNLDIQAGNYQASIDAPDDFRIRPTTGTVDVKEFHHYEADFIVVPSDGPSPSFYIGD